MNKIFLSALTLLALTACNNNSKQTDTERPVVKEAAPETGIQQPALNPGCYEYNKDNNTIRLEITEVEDKVSGNLTFALAEKDDNEGTFPGTIHGDKIIGAYTFSSEGKESTREVAFLIKGDQLIEGFGELDSTGTKFKEVNTIQYNSTMPLTQVDCNG